MNIICQFTEHAVCGMFLVKALTPSGQLVLVNHKGTKEEAIEKALLAEPEPA